MVSSVDPPSADEEVTKRTELAPIAAGGKAAHVVGDPEKSGLVSALASLDRLLAAKAFGYRCLILLT